MKFYTPNRLVSFTKYRTGNILVENYNFTKKFNVKLHQSHNYK